MFFIVGSMFIFISFFRCSCCSTWLFFLLRFIFLFFFLRHVMVVVSDLVLVEVVVTFVGLVVVTIWCRFGCGGEGFGFVFGDGGDRSGRWLRWWWYRIWVVEVMWWWWLRPGAIGFL
jgi:hypothetical protein